jgi:uncharacterized protein YwqG
MSNVIRMIFGRKNKKTSGPVRDVAALASRLGRDALHIVKTSDPSQSFFGGDPQLPSDRAWPSRQGTRLRFLARLSLVELQSQQPVEWLPQTGALVFFYDDDKQPWGFDPADRGGWAVLHVPDVAATSTGSSPESSGVLSHSAVAFRRIQVLPSSERPDVEALKLSDEEFDRYFELLEQRFEGHPKHQVLGIPSPVQGDAMELECQLASNGVYCGSPEAYATSQAQQLKDGARHWRLLLQVDSDDELGMMWGDGGLIYFWVEEAAARQGDFSNVWLVLQCT